ncbi:MAG: rhomboid family intramembrane serine protease [Deltaproteobacteria bacterium]|nr:rhomboid family intramembrane serine protease [Deltaproteobacteria bacterium]
MIPIRDINPRVRVPFVNFLLLVLIALAFVLQLVMGHDDTLVRAFGFVPSELLQAIDRGRLEAAPGVALSVVTSVFLHGGWFHVLGNLIYLRVFGDNVEDRLGHLGFVAFFFASAIFGAALHAFITNGSSTPVIGASGAISGVLGAYVVMFPRAPVLTLFPIFVFLSFIEVPAFLFLGVWALQQFLNGYLVIAESVHQEGVAWLVHVGGFGLGIFVGLVSRLLHGRRRDRGEILEEA